MSIPPSMLRIGFPREDGEDFGLWLPLFLLWPLLLLVGLIALVVALAADIVLLLTRARYHEFTLLLFRVVDALNATRGLSVYVDSVDGRFDFRLA